MLVRSSSLLLVLRLARSRHAPERLERALAAGPHVREDTPTTAARRASVAHLARGRSASSASLGVRHRGRRPPPAARRPAPGCARRAPRRAARSASAAGIHFCSHTPSSPLSRGPHREQQQRPAERPSGQREAARGSARRRRPARPSRRGPGASSERVPSGRAREPARGVEPSRRRRRARRRCRTRGPSPRLGLQGPSPRDQQEERHSDARTATRVARRLRGPLGPQHLREAHRSCSLRRCESPAPCP